MRVGHFRDFEHLQQISLGGLPMVVQQDNGERTRVPSQGSLIDHVCVAIDSWESRLDRWPFDALEFLVDADDGDHPRVRVLDPAGLLIELTPAG